MRDIDKIGNGCPFAWGRSSALPLLLSTSLGWGKAAVSIRFYSTEPPDKARGQKEPLRTFPTHAILEMPAVDAQKIKYSEATLLARLPFPRAS
jgi:hypothetical protein